MPIVLATELDSLSAMQIACRDAIRALDTYDDQHCNVESEELPANLGEYYVAIRGSLSAGPSHGGNNGLLTDEMVAIDAILYMRTERFVSDRLRELLLQGTKSFNMRVAKIRETLEPVDDGAGGWFSIMTAANALLDTGATGQGFCERLHFMSQDREPRPIPASYFQGEAFDGGTDAEQIYAGLMQTIRFDGARRLRDRNSL